MKLEGLRVIDLSLFLPGPYLSLMLADHGAEVIKIEPPGEGDPTRHLGPRDGGETVYFRNLNRKEERGRRPEESAGSRSAARALRYGGRVRRVVPARRGGAPRRGLRAVARAQSAHRLLLDQRVRPAGAAPRP